MNVERFKKWMEFNGRPRNTVQNRISNCRNVEKYEGNLDQHFAQDYGLSLIEKLSYSISDERNNSPANHKIPINGNIRNGSATLKQAINLYFSYRKDNGKEFNEFVTELETIEAYLEKKNGCKNLTESWFTMCDQDKLKIKILAWAILFTGIFIGDLLGRASVKRNFEHYAPLEYELYLEDSYQNSLDTYQQQPYE